MSGTVGCGGGQDDVEGLLTPLRNLIPSKKRRICIPCTEDANRALRMAPGTTCQKQGGGTQHHPHLRVSLYLCFHIHQMSQCLLSLCLYPPPVLSPYLPVCTSPFPHLHIVPKSPHIPKCHNVLYPSVTIPTSPDPYTSPYYPHVPKCPPEAELLGHTRVPAEFVSLEGKRLSVRIKEREEVWAAPRRSSTP